LRNRVQILIITLLFSIPLFGQEYHLIIKTDVASNKIIKSHQNFRGDSIAIHNELRFLLNELQSEAYLAASIDSLQYDSTNVFAYLYLGKKYQWSKLDFSLLEPQLLDELSLKRKSFDLVNLNDLKQMKSQILSYYENSGYPFVNVFLDELQMEDSVLSAKIDVSKGEYYAMDSIFVKGDAKISSTYIKKTIQLDKGKPFNQKKINDISKRINDIKFLAEIKPSEIEFKEENVDLYLYLQNKKANMFNGIIGFLPENEESGDLLITGELNLNLVNSFRRGEDIYLNWEKMESSTQKLDVGFMFPYLFKTDLGLDADFGLYKKDSTYLSINTGLGLRLFLSYDDYIKAYYRYKSSTRIGDEEEISTLVNYADVKSNIFGVSYYLNDLDYRYNPRRGIEIKLFAGAGFKNIIDAKNTIDSLNLNPDEKSIELEAGLDLDLYFPIYKNFVFHFGNTTRYLDQFSDGDKDVVFFENELYRFGGAKSLRGFDESIFFASIYSLQNVEIKYLFEQNSAFYIFWNGAYYYQNITESVTEDFPWGFGIGMDFQTKAGIFSLSYALGKQFDNPIEIRTAKIHFGYISRF